MLHVGRVAAACSAGTTLVVGSRRNYLGRFPFVPSFDATLVGSHLSTRTESSCVGSAQFRGPFNFLTSKANWLHRISPSCPFLNFVCSDLMVGTMRLLTIHRNGGQLSRRGVHPTVDYCKMLC